MTGIAEGGLEDRVIVGSANAFGDWDYFTLKENGAFDSFVTTTVFAGKIS